MLLYNILTFYDELSVFWFRFPPQFRLILHPLDPDPDPEPQSNADPMRIRNTNLRQKRINTHS
jgi:hypothetical protein